MMLSVCFGWYYDVIGMFWVLVSYVWCIPSLTMSFVGVSRARLWFLRNIPSPNMVFLLCFEKYVRVLGLDYDGRDSEKCVRV